VSNDCKARQFSDQMQCGKCGLAWDVNDPEPPACKPITYPSWKDQDRKRGREVLARLRGELDRLQGAP